MDDFEQKPVQYTIPNYHLDNAYEWLQYANRLTAHIICIELHITIIFRLLHANNFRVKSDYQILIIVQSVINVIASISELILMEIQTLNRFYLKVGHPWWHFSKDEKLVYTMMYIVFSNSTQDFLAVFNLHRYFLIKGKSIKKLYVIVIPIMVLGVFGDVINAYPTVMKDEDADLFFKYSQLPLLSAIIIFCWSKLKKEFKNNTHYSEKTKRLQEKLSWSILLQLFLSAVIAVLISLIPTIFEIFAKEEVYHKFDVQYTIIVLCLTQWYPLLSAILIAWSITGFLKTPGNQNTGNSNSDVRIVVPATTAVAADIPRRTSHKISVI